MSQASLQRLRNALHEIYAFMTMTKSSIVGVIIVVGYIFIAFVGPYVVPIRLVGTFEPNLPPSLDHLAGTDHLGRDLFGFIVHGAMQVIVLATMTSLITTFLAVTIGTAAGIVGGKANAFLTFCTDVMLTIPGFPLTIVLATMIRGSPNMLLLASVLAIIGWPAQARSIRSQVLSVKNRDFVEASRSVGLGTAYIIFFDILPSLAPYIVISTMRAMINAIYSLVGLSILGALPYDETSWGIIINRAINQGHALLVPAARTALIVPLVAIVILQISVILLSSSFEIMFNPRLRDKTLRSKKKREGQTE